MYYCHNDDVYVFGNFLVKENVSEVEIKEKVKDLENNYRRTIYGPFPTVEFNTTEYQDKEVIDFLNDTVDTRDKFLHCQDL
jgi:hypothetical protein